MPGNRSATRRVPRQVSLRATGWRLLSAFRNALLPSRCAGCGVWVTAVDLPGLLSGRIGPGAAGRVGTQQADQLDGALAAAMLSAGMSSLAAMLCPSCRQHIVRLRSPFCSVCGQMFKTREGLDHRCKECIRQPKHYTIARSALLYTHGFRRVIHQFKYRGKIYLAAPLGEILLATFLRFWDSDDMDLILPVPLHRRRFRHRGFNQAYRLIAHWKHLDRRFAATPRLLVRTRATAPQTGLGKAQRRQNLRHAFAVQFPEAIRSRRVLLVDDVYTTGATANECARVLMRCGAERVDVLTLARAV